MRNLLVVLTLWQVTSAQESCPDLQLSAPLGALLGNIPISNSAPSLPSLPLPSGCSSYLPTLPNLGDCDYSSFPSLPSLPSLGDLDGCECSSFPSLPSLPELDGYDDYPYFSEPLPYQKKKCCLAKLLTKPKLCSCLKSCGLKNLKGGLKKCGCGLKDCGCGLKEFKGGLKQKFGLELKVKLHPPVILPFLTKKKIGDFGALTELPCEIPSLISDAFTDGLAGCY